MPSLIVNTPSHDYPIHIGDNTLDLLKTKGRVFAFVDENVDRLHSDIIPDYDHKIVVPSGESSKRIELYNQYINQLLAWNISRKDTILAIGGGVVGDLVGFIAATVLRGVDYVQIPTTLLAMVDSSVGGKTGINSDHGKNLIGAFNHPTQVLIDIRFLSSLPDRQYRSGYAEIVKYGLILDRNFYDILDAGDYDIQSVILRCCEIKSDVVRRDERENGIRSLLNLGHTYGHAIESAYGYDGTILHGEAVAIGTVMAFDYAKRTGMCDDVKKIINHFNKNKLPIDLKSFLRCNKSPNTMLDIMGRDKKVESGTWNLILPKRIGECIKTSDIDHSIIEQKWKELLS